LLLRLLNYTESEQFWKVAQFVYRVPWHLWVRKYGP